MDSDCRLPNNIIDDENVECLENHAWLSDYSNSEDDEVYTDQHATPLTQVRPNKQISIVI